MGDEADNRNILVIDDELGLREGCRRVLSRYNYEVETAATGHDGLSRALATDFALILLDVKMPDINGIDLLQHLRSHRPQAACVIMTAYATVEMAVQAMKLGAYDFIEKPFSDDALLEAVQRGLDRRRLDQAADGLAAGLDRGSPLGLGLPAPGSSGRVDQARSAYTRKVAHELRAPVAAIRSFLTLILQGYTTPEKTREWQQRAADRADDLLKLIDDVLNLARLQDPKLESLPELVSLEAVLQDVLGLHTPEAEAKGIRLRVEARPCEPVVADIMHIKQLWTNLVSNAIKYTPMGGRVSIRLYPEGKQIVGEVADTGIGIAEEDHVHLFQEFYRTEQARALAQHGTGLGLSIVKQIVEQYGGEIGVESRLGRGSKFTFRLPVKGPARPGS